MEEKQIGYVVISSKEYTELIERKIKADNDMNEFYYQDKKDKEINEKLENHFFKYILYKNDYHIKNMKECNPTDFNYQEIYQEFLKIGITDAKYIDSRIKTIKLKYENGEYEESED